MHKHGVECGGFYYNGHLDVVHFLCQHRTEGNVLDALDWAAMNGHFEVVRVLHQILSRLQLQEPVL